MPHRADHLDTRGWYPGSFARVREDPPPPPTHVPTYRVVFLDRRDATRWKAPRLAEVDCLPETWTRMEVGELGFIRRTWRLEHGDAGALYRELAPQKHEPPTPKGSAKGGRPKPEAEAEADDA